MKSISIKTKGSKPKKYQLGNIFSGVLSGQGSQINSVINNAIGKIGAGKSNKLDISTLGSLSEEEIGAFFNGSIEPETVNEWIRSGKVTNEELEYAQKIQDDQKGPSNNLNYGMGLANSMKTFSELNSDGNIDTADISQTAGDFLAGSSQYSQIGKQVGQIATSIIGQDATTNTLGEGVEYQKAGITSMNKALEYGAAGAEYGGLPGAAIGAVAGATIGLVQGGKARREAEKEFYKLRKDRINRFKEYSKNQYADQYIQQAIYAEKGGININPENKGKFKAYCKHRGYTKVTNDCIEEGKASSSKIINKRATFAQSAREWNK